MTDPVAACLDDSMRQTCQAATHDFEGIGETSTHYIDLATSRGATGGAGARLFRPADARSSKFELGGMPYVLGLKKPADGFRSLGRDAAGPGPSAIRPR